MSPEDTSQNLYEMVDTRLTFSGSITCESALEAEYDVLRRLTWPQKAADFIKHISDHLLDLAQAAATLLGVYANRCIVENRTEAWLRGSFNICIPLRVRKWKDSQDKLFMIRIPLPYKIGEDYSPGNVDEKLRCEAATYIWLSENCPDVPIPRLWGCGLRSGQAFAATEAGSFWTRHKNSLKSHSNKTKGLATRYASVQCSDVGKVGTGFLLIDLITSDQGKMLSNTWHQHCDNEVLRKNYFRDLARIILSISRIPHERIGAYTLQDDCSISLTNRPLTHESVQLEDEGISTGMLRNTTYDNAMSYQADVFKMHENRFQTHPNGVSSRDDCYSQAAVLFSMRALQSTFSLEDRKNGPFVMTLTDLHMSNIFVDDDWHITALIDLEWACTRPLEKLCMSYRWVPDIIERESRQRLQSLHSDFIDVLFEIEQEVGASQTRNPATPAENEFVSQHVLSSSLRWAWKTGAFWYHLALDWREGPVSLFEDEVRAIFLKDNVTEQSYTEFCKVAAQLWKPNFEEFVDARLRDKAAYDEKIREIFAASQGNDVEGHAHSNVSD